MKIQISRQKWSRREGLKTPYLELCSADFGRVKLKRKPIRLRVFRCLFEFLNFPPKVVPARFRVTTLSQEPLGRFDWAMAQMNCLDVRSAFLHTKLDNSNFPPKLVPPRNFFNAIFARCGFMGSSLSHRGVAKNGFVDYLFASGETCHWLSKHHVSIGQIPVTQTHDNSFSH